MRPRRDWDELLRRQRGRPGWGGRAFITGTVVRGRFWLRACIINHRAAKSDVDTTADVVMEAAARAG